MKWLRIIPSMNPAMGGPSQGIRNSIPELGRSGVQNEVVCFDDANAPYLREEKFPIHALGPSKGPWAYCPKLSQWLMENLSRFDVVIVHGLWLYHSYAAIRVFLKYKKSQSGKIPFLYVMPHGMLDPYFQKAKGRKLKAIRNWLYWKFIEKRLIHEADGLLFTSEEELILARQAFQPYRPKRELNISYGVKEPPVFSQAMKDAFDSCCQGATKRSYILFLSRLHPKKGVDLLISSYLQLKQEGYELPQLIIAGPGLDSPYGSELKAAGKDADIIFPGMLTGSAKWGAFYGAEAFVLPSHQENFGIAVAEALACSKPVLITDKVNIWREIQVNKAGVVVPDTQQGIMGALKKWLLLTAAEKKVMAAQAGYTFSQCFSIEDTARKMAMILKRIKHENQNLNT